MGNRIANIPADEERYTAFTKELGELSTKYGVAIIAVGGVWIFEPGAVIEYDDDYTSGDLLYTVDGES